MSGRDCEPRSLQAEWLARTFDGLFFLAKYDNIISALTFKVKGKASENILPTRVTGNTTVVFGVEPHGDSARKTQSRCSDKSSGQHDFLWIV